MRQICIITGTRAEYGLLYWLMKEIQNQIVDGNCSYVFLNYRSNYNGPHNSNQLLS